MAGLLIQATERTEIEDGLRPGSPGVVLSGRCGKYIFPLPRNAFPREGAGMKNDFFSARKFHFWRS